MMFQDDNNVQTATQSGQDFLQQFQHQLQFTSNGQMQIQNIETISQITADGNGAGMGGSSSLGSFVNCAPDDPSLQFVNNQDLKNSLVGATKPTHRRKKSQQPTLMSTKQKQGNSNNNHPTPNVQPNVSQTQIATVAPSSNRENPKESFIESSSSEPQLKFEFLHDEVAKFENVNQEKRLGSHQRAATQYQMPVDSMQQLSQQPLESEHLKPSQGAKASNLNLKQKEKSPPKNEQNDFTYQNRFNSQNNEINHVQTSPQGPQFQALHHMRERMASIGSNGTLDLGLKLSNEKQKQAIIQAQSNYIQQSSCPRQSAPTGQKMAPTNLIDARKAVKKQKLTTAKAPSIQVVSRSSNVGTHERSSTIENQPSSSMTLQSRQNQQQTSINHHKRNQTKSHFPAANLLLQNHFVSHQNRMDSQIQASAEGPSYSCLPQQKQGQDVRKKSALQPPSSADTSSNDHAQKALNQQQKPTHSIIVLSKLAQTHTEIQPTHQKTSLSKVGNNSEPLKSSQEELIKSLMKKHLAPQRSDLQEDAKAAYLRHAASSNSQKSSSQHPYNSNTSNGIINDINSKSPHTQGFQNAVTPNKQEDSSSALLGGVHHQSQPKRVTFGPSDAIDSDEEDEGNDESDDEQIASYIKEEASKDEEEQQFETNRQQEMSQHARQGSHHRRTRFYMDSKNAEQILSPGVNRVQTLKDNNICLVNYSNNSGDFREEEEEEEVENAYGQADGSIINHEENNSQLEEAPTVVIDTSIDEKEGAVLMREMKGPQSEYCGGGDQEASTQQQQNPSFAVLDNIQAALRSIRKQEEEERFEKSAYHGSDGGEKKKKAVTIMTIEEEEALINQINEIRARIKRGETAAQQQNKQTHELDEPEEESYAESNRKNSQMVQSESQRQIRKEFANQETPLNEYGGQQTTLHIPASFVSADCVSSHNGGIMIIKPPLYSLTFAHQEDEHSQISNNFKSDAYGINSEGTAKPTHNKSRSFHSIDSNVPPSDANCLIVTDGPNIYEKKRQRFEKIQRMRNGSDAQSMALRMIPQNDVNFNSVTSNQGVSQMQGGDSQCGSGNYSSLVKKPQQQILGSNDQSKKKPNTSGKTKKSTSSLKGKNSQKNPTKQGTSSSVRRSGVGLSSHSALYGNHKSRQHSTIEQLISGPQSLTTQSQYQQQHHQPHHSQYYHQLQQMAGAAIAQLGGTASKSSLKRQSLYPSHHAPSYSHYTLDPDRSENNGTNSYNDIASSIIVQREPNTFRNSNRGSGVTALTGSDSKDRCSNEDEEMQIQLFSLKKIMPGGGQQAKQIGAAAGEKIKINRCNGGTSSQVGKKKLMTKSRKTASINGALNGQTTSQPIKMPNYAAAGFSNPHMNKGQHLKNQKSNLVINVPLPEGLSHINPHQVHSKQYYQNASLAQSLSQKRLKTPKQKANNDVNTPPIERNSIGMYANAQNSKMSQFQSVPQFKHHENPSAIFSVRQSSSSAKHQQNPNNSGCASLNYQTAIAAGVNTGNGSYKSPFNYPQTSKASGSSQNKLQKQGHSEMKIIDSNSNRGKSPGHTKQKSQHTNILSSQQLLQSQNNQYSSSKNSQGMRSGSLGSGNSLTSVPVPQKFVTIESSVVNKLLLTKRETDQAFDMMKRKLSDKRSILNQEYSITPQHFQVSSSTAKPLQMIQPTGHISTVSSGTTSAQLLPSCSGIQEMSAYTLTGSGGKKRHSGCGDRNDIIVSTFSGGHIHNQRASSTGSQQQSLMDFERNYRKLSGMLDKIFTL